jgi:hypothetical protein
MYSPDRSQQRAGCPFAGESLHIGASSKKTQFPLPLFLMAILCAMAGVFFSIHREKNDDCATAAAEFNDV